MCIISEIECDALLGDWTWDHTVSTLQYVCVCVYSCSSVQTQQTYKTSPTVGQTFTASASRERKDSGVIKSQECANHSLNSVSGHLLPLCFSCNLSLSWIFSAFIGSCKNSVAAASSKYCYRWICWLFLWSEAPWSFIASDHKCFETCIVSTVITG